MSARILTAYLVSVGLAAGIISQALAKPPDLPAKVQINCEKCSDKLMLKTYQVADLVIPVEGAPGLDEVFQTPVSARPEAVPGPAPVLAHPPEEVIPQPYGFVTLPVPGPAQYVPVPLMSAPVFGIAKSSATQAPKPCCPACASANCNGYGSDVPCQAPACVAAGCASTQVNAPKKTLEDQLIRLIVSTVKPESWDVNGGRGTIDYFPLGMALTVNQTAEVQERVAHLLGALRRLQDEQIAVEVRFISVPQGFGDRIATQCTNCCGHCDSSCCEGVLKTHTGSITLGASLSSDAGLSGSISVKEASAGDECCSKDSVCCKPSVKFTFLSDAQVQKFMDGLQANPKTNVMMAPKLTVFNGQTGNINVMEQQFFFVTDVKTIRHEDHEIFIPHNEPISTGVSFSVKPTYSADHQFFQVNFEAEQKTLTTSPENVPLYHVTPLLTHQSENGPKAEPVPFILQQPAVIVQRIQQKVCIPCGQTVLLKTWTHCDKVPEECGVPILSCLPYVGDMFKKVSYHEETADVWIMITPRILVNEQEEVHPPVAAAAPTVTDNLHKLQQARVLLEQADHCRRMGQPESARHIYERVRELCPGSRYAQMATRRMKLLQVPQAGGELERGASTPRPMLVSEFLALKNRPEFKKEQEVSDYLSQYWRACAEGRLSEATQWAVQALALDPACFSKARQAGWKKTPQPVVMPSAN